MIISKLGETGKPLKNIIDVLNDIVMAGIMYIMWFVPFGVASLISKAIFAMDTNLEETMNQVAWYFATVLIGLMIHWFIVLPIIFFAVVRTNPYTYMLGLSRALVTAFGTSSSACTLPITMQCVEQKLGIDSRISKFILPLGCTVNMDGTALMEGVAAIAISQMEGTVLTIPQICSLSITATLASIGASSIPSSGLIMLTMILTSLGVNTRHIALLWAIDWLLDRFRTVVNVVGDSIGCAVVQKLCWKELTDGSFDTRSMDKSMDNTVANSTELSNAGVSGTILVTPGKNVSDVERNGLMHGYVTEVQTLVNSPEVGNEVATKV
jgi:Na+/H+-dicarboxylate symporter